MTRVLHSVSEWRALQKELVSTSLGFIPTMGALHAGHASLFQRSLAENQRTLASIFVNPTQFNDPKDFERYPKTFENDLRLLNEVGVDYVFAPTAAEMYPGGYVYSVQESQESLVLEGAHRPGHFTGMLTVVLKLLNIAKATKAYFGEKDYQQLQLIRGMAKSFFIETEIVACPTIREMDRLALSSRNRFLSPEQRILAPQFYEVLNHSLSCEDAIQKLEALGFEVDYVAEYWGRRLGAVKFGSLRLIDNVAYPGKEHHTYDSHA